MLPQPRTVDRPTARLIAYKRIMTGSLSIASGIVFAVLVALHGSPPPIAAVAFLLLVGGGSWTLRDGLRLRRAVQERSYSSASEKRYEPRSGEH
jgi:hypothetical protein